MTPKQQKLLAFITAYIERTGGVSPSFAEMAAHMNMKSKSSITRVVTGLKARGYVTSKPASARSVAVVRRADGCCATCGRPMP